jgi:hypothetical protein
MVTKDGFDPDDSLPLFLSADEPEQGIGNVRFAMASILVATATAIGSSILSAGNPVTDFADVTASLADKSAPQPSIDQSTPIIQSVAIQSTADAEALPPTAQDVPTREINAPEPASQTKKEIDEASLEALFREFQAWNAEQDARDLAKPVQDDPAPVAKNASASLPTQKHRMARTIRNAQAEMIRNVRERRANVRQQNERVQARPLLYARGQTQSVQYAEPPSFLRELLPF